LIDNLSIKTPFTNIGDEKSKYAGNNNALKNWYTYKEINLNNIITGNAKGDFPDLYSCYSKTSANKLGI
jgi:hypothetical protein